VVAVGFEVGASACVVLGAAEAVPDAEADGALLATGAPLAGGAALVPVGVDAAATGAPEAFAAAGVAAVVAPVLAGSGVACGSPHPVSESPAIAAMAPSPMARGAPASPARRWQ
jgi:hypothetical protein